MISKFLNDGYNYEEFNMISLLFIWVNVEEMKDNHSIVEIGICGMELAKVSKYRGCMLLRVIILLNELALLSIRWYKKGTMNWINIVLTWW